MSSSALANRYSARMGDSLGGAFHVTYVDNRLALHFGAFAPWNVRKGDPIAIMT